MALLFSRVAELVLKWSLHDGVSALGELGEEVVERRANRVGDYEGTYEKCDAQNNGEPSKQEPYDVRADAAQQQLQHARLVFHASHAAQ